MNLRKLLKLFHIIGTVWLALCAAFLLVVALRQAGAGWWIVFSLSGFSGVAFFLLMSIYLFAIFRGVTRKQLSLEHPLTTSPVYFFFYDMCPLLGTLAGFVTILTVAFMSAVEKAGIIAEGTLGMTFLIWIIGDPVISLTEGVLPSSVKYRRDRLALEKEKKENRDKEKQELLEQIRRSDQIAQEKWDQILIPIAGDLADHLSTSSEAGEEIRPTAVQFGARAWQLGGMACMQHLLRLVNQQLSSKKLPPHMYLPFWWDGIGTWRKPALKEAFSVPTTS